VKEILKSIKAGEAPDENEPLYNDDNGSDYNPTNEVIPKVSPKVFIVFY